MIKGKSFFSLLKRFGFDFITGVPCSTYTDLLKCINSSRSGFKHFRASSEGEAMGIAAGYYLAARKPAVIYMQNSGFGNSVNPLTSLLDPEVYGIPALLLVSWRGEPNIPDEPQHVKMGKILPELLNVMDIPYRVASPEAEELYIQIKELKKLAMSKKQPVALIVRKGIILKEKKGQKKVTKNSLMDRETVLKILLEKIGANTVVSTTGKTSREIFEIREARRQGHQYDFLTVGSMGCASAIAFGISQKYRKRVFLIDGDGALLLKMGNITTIGNYQPKNLVHIVINNDVHESTGNQPVNTNKINWKGLFSSVGYQAVDVVNNEKKLKSLNFSKIKRYPLAIVIKVRPGSRSDLGRPTSTTHDNKREFMKHLKG